MSENPHPVRFEVIQKNRFIYVVQEIRSSRQDGYEYRSQVRWFFKLKIAEACAQGLAEGTWTEEGPIMASFLIPQYKETEVELPN